jgi:hypothetical protein
LENKMARVVTPAVGVPVEDVFGKQDGAEVAVEVPEEERTWLENEMARWLVGCGREDW